MKKRNISDKLLLYNIMTAEIIHSETFTFEMDVVVTSFCELF
jgi:hypothetical protein